MLDRLQTIGTTKTNLKIGVRLTRMWPSTSNNGNTFHGMNLILLDSENYHVQAFVVPDIWKYFADLLVEGNTYQITDFVTREARGKLRPVSSNVLIHFTHFTIAQPLIDEAIIIPRIKFELIELGQVYEIANSFPPDKSPDYAIDVIGVVEDVEPIEVISTHFGEKQSVQFKLYDGRQTIKVALWDEHIASLDPILLGNFQSMPIVILTSFGVTSFRGTVQLMTLQSSRIYVNPVYEAVGPIMQRLIHQGYEPHVNAP